METSAKASINVEEAFFTLARDIKAKMEKKLVIYPGLLYSYCNALFSNLSLHFPLFFSFWMPFSSWCLEGKLFFN